MSAQGGEMRSDNLNTSIGNDVVIMQTLPRQTTTTLSYPIVDDWMIEIEAQAHLPIWHNTLHQWSLIVLAPKIHLDIRTKTWNGKNEFDTLTL